MRGRLVGLMVVVGVLFSGVALVACGDGGSTETAGSTEQESTGGADSSEGAGKTFSYLGVAGSTDFLDGLDASFMPAWEEESGFKTALDNFCCGTDKLKAQISADSVTWSAIAWATQIEFEEAKEADLLEKLDTSVIDVSKLQPGTYDEYGYDTWKFAAVVGWLPGTYPEGEEPTSFKDLFDTEKFPGKRCLYKYHEFGGTLEGALLAEGVPADEIYPLDLDLAFEKLSSMKDDIVWWDSGAQPAQYLLNGTCKIAAIWNGVAQTTTKRGNPIEIAWPESITIVGVNTVPKNSPNPEAAQKFLGMLIENREAQEEFYEHTAYTIPLKDPAISDAAAQWAPEGENVQDSIAEDEQYYAENNEEISKAFEDFLVTEG